MAIAESENVDTKIETAYKTYKIGRLAYKYDFKIKELPGQEGASDRLQRRRPKLCTHLQQE